MKVNLLFLFCTLMFLTLFSSVFAKNGEEFIVQKFLAVDDALISDFNLAVSRLDSIEMLLSLEQSETFKPFLDYSYARLAFKKGNYRKSLLLTDKAIEKFLYMGENEWVARCLVNMGHLAEVSRLIPEAVNAYKLVLEQEPSPYIRGSAHLGLARNNYRLHQPWEEDLKVGTEIYQELDNPYLRLYAKFIYYWFYQDSTDVTQVLPQIADEFKAMHQYAQEADAYKCLVFYFDQVEDYDSALYYIDKSIAAYQKEDYNTNVLLSSAYHLKGKILLAMNHYDDAMEVLSYAINLNSDLGLEGNNYQLYKYLFEYEEARGNYAYACELARQMTISYRYFSDLRIQRFENMSRLYRKIKFIENELDDMRLKSLYRMLIVSLFVLLFVIIILWWVRTRQLSFEKRSAEMEVNNLRLREEAGELLRKTKHVIFANELSKTMEDFERKAERYLAENKELPAILKEKYAETFLLCGAKFPQLSDSEKRFAVMLILDIKPKNIAELFNVQQLTVSQYRHRIRKKLFISNTDIRLEEFLKQQIL